MRLETAFSFHFTGSCHWKVEHCCPSALCTWPQSPAVDISVTRGPAWNGSSSPWLSACHSFPLLRNMSRLHVCSRLRGPPADNYRYLFFINEVKSQHSLPFFERETFFSDALAPSTDACFVSNGWTSAFASADEGGLVVIPTDTHLAGLYSKQ